MAAPAVKLLMAAGGSGGAFDPSTVSGLRAWFDASDTGTLTLSGSEVTQWNDKSGNGCHLTRPSGKTGPSSGTRSKNSLNVCDFGNASPGGSPTICLDDASHSIFPAPTSHNYQMFVVFVNDATPVTNPAAVCWFGSATGSTRHGLRVETSRARTAFCSVGGTADSTGSAVANGTWEVVTGTYPTATNTETLRENGTQTASATMAGTPSALQFNVATVTGAIQRAFDGAIGEFLIYTTIPSTTERDAIEAYLSAKWAVP